MVLSQGLEPEAHPPLEEIRLSQRLINLAENPYGCTDSITVQKVWGSGRAIPLEESLRVYDIKLDY